MNDGVDYFANPLAGVEGGSAADVRVHVVRTFVGDGFAGLDYDGRHANEGGVGGLDV